MRDSIGDFKSYVTVGIWNDPESFRKEVGQYFNDKKPMLPFEKYRRRRVILGPVAWRIGRTKLRSDDSPGVG